MIALLKPFWIGIIKWCALIGAGVVFLLRVKQSGKEAELRKNMLQTLKGVQTRDEIENNATFISDNKLNKLRKKWERS